MEEKGCEVGGGQGPINPNATAPFDGVGEQLAVDVGVEQCECTAPDPEVELPTSTDFISSSLGLDDKMPFLQMLQTLYSTNSIHSDDSLKNNSLKVEHQILEVVDSCMPKLHSPAMSDAKCHTQADDNSVTTYHQSKRSLTIRKMRKPKRAKVVVENKKDAEKQRMTHIAVERNRRRLMSDYLDALRSLLPPYYAPKGDQASIVGGVIDYLKQLEQQVKYLENQKMQKNMDELNCGASATTSTSLSDDTLEDNNFDQLGKTAKVNIMVVQTHANLRMECEDMKQNQLIKFLAAVEDLGLTILHLCINSIHKSSFYSISLKMEDECKIRSAEEISSSVAKVLNSLNISNGTRGSSVTNQDEARNVKNEY